MKDAEESTERWLGFSEFHTDATHLPTAVYWLLRSVALLLLLLGDGRFFCCALLYGVAASPAFGSTFTVHHNELRAYKSHRLKLT